MNLTEAVQAAVSKFVLIDEAHDGVAVTTHCMYPSNALVRVHVRGVGESFVVTDNGNTVFELKSSGVPVDYSARAIRNYLGEHDLMFDKDVIVSPEVSIDFLPVMILVVANAATETAAWLLSHAKWNKKKAFKEVVRELLHEKFPINKPQEVTIVGASKKPHKFENVIQMKTGKRLIVDAVVHDPASINARFVANIDVHNAQIEGLEQRIVFDDEDTWPNADLALLNVSGAIIVPYAKASSVMDRLAANE